MALYLGENKVSANSISSNYAEGFEAGKTEGYNKGKMEGYAEGKEIGITEGIQLEYDRFWDSYLRPDEWHAPGSKMNCNGMFQSFGWKDSIFRPKYILRPSMAGSMFNYSSITDLAGILEECGSGLDTTECISFLNMFSNSAITRIPEISVMVPINETVCDAMFYYCTDLQEIRKIVIGEGKNVLFANAFTNCTSLTTVAFEGEITRDINFQWSPLSTTSINSIITHLSGTETGKTATFKLSAVNAAFETAEGLADGSSSQMWLDLVATKPNWTISLV